jgi:hypothetical protein
MHVLVEEWVDISGLNAAECGMIRGAECCGVRVVSLSGGRLIDPLHALISYVEAHERRARADLPLARLSHV